MYDYLEKLNHSQRAAVENTNGASLIIAGAGSGKTRVLTVRIAHLLKLGTKPSAILALTFTNKAAREMKERIKNIAGQPAKHIWMGTFHSIFARILRTNAQNIGYTSNFTIYDTTDSKNLIKTIVKELNLDPKVYKPGTVLSRISNAKNELILPEAYAANGGLRDADKQSRMPQIFYIYKIYTHRCRKANAMDFDDLLLFTNTLFQNHHQVLKSYQERFRYILVDEYQDTNFSQYQILKMLAAAHKNICVVGDDAQSIYAFRGAKIENILNFKNDYPQCKVFKLEQNYRSTQNIVDAANSLIKKNKRQLPKQVFSENEPGTKISVLEASNDHEEGFLVVNSISDELMRNNAKYLDFAILYRTNAQSRIFEETLRKRNIPYKIYGGLSFYQRKEIKDLLAYCRLSINPNDDEALKRVINYPKRGIGKTTLDKLEATASKYAVSLWQVLEKLANEPTGLAKATLTRLEKFRQLIQYFAEKIPNTQAYDMGKEIASKSGILSELFKEKTPENISRHDNIEELLNGIKEFSEQNAHHSKLITLEQYMQEVALLTNDDTENDEEKNRVLLMTIHSAKGLEFKYVYIVGLEEELFPSQFSAGSAAELEEERRLFYVAVTRAEKKLTLSYAHTRYRWGNLINARPSRFITEIDINYIDLPDATDYGFDHQYGQEAPQTYEKKTKPWLSKKNRYEKPLENKKILRQKLRTQPPTPPNENQPTRQPASAGGLKVGNLIEHQRFGKGKVIKIEGGMPNTKATILFDSAGQKKLLLKFAKLKILD